MARLASIWGLLRASSGPGVRLGSAYLCSVSFFICILLSFLASTLLLRSSASYGLLNDETRLVLDVYKGKFGGKLDSIRRFENPDFFSNVFVHGYTYANDLYNMSGALSIEVVNDICKAKFCRDKYHCDLKPSSDRKHKALVVFLPDDGVTKYNPRLLYQIQGSIFSTLASGTFDPNAQVVFIRAHLRDHYHDTLRDYIPAPLHAFRAYDVCKSLASTTPFEKRNFRHTAPYGVVQYILEGHRHEITRKTPFIGYRYVETPSALMLGWYHLLAFNNTEGDRDAEKRLFGKLFRYIMRGLPYVGPNIRGRQVVHPNQVIPTVSLADNAVVMVFGNNQFFAYAIKAGRLLAKPPGDSGPVTGKPRGLGYFYPSALSPKSGLVENTDECVKLTSSAIAKDGIIYGDHRHDFCYPLLTPSMLLDNRKGNKVVIKRYEYLPARDVLHDAKNLLCDTDDPTICRFITYNRQYMRDSIIYPGVHYYYAHRYGTMAFMSKNYLKSPSDTRYNSIYVANVGLANFMAALKPNKIIQIELIPHDDSLPDLIPGEVRNAPNKDAYLPLVTTMGCPSVGLTNINVNEIKNHIDSSIMSYCSKDSPRRMEYGLRHCDSFSTYFDNIENNLPNDRINDKSLPYSSCRNTVLTLHMTDDPDSVFNYGKMINYYHQIIAHHLASGCDTEFSKTSVDVGECKAYNTRYMYDVEKRRMYVVDTGEEVVPVCNISRDESYIEHGKGKMLVAPYDPYRRSNYTQRVINMCNIYGIVTPVTTSSSTR